jgi:hypothetical protein
MLKRFPILLGLAIAVVMYFIHGGWWLDAGDRGRDTLIALAAVSFILVVGFSWSQQTWHPGRDLWIGYMAGMTIILFAIGPGTIFPIVLFIGGAMSGLAVLAGYGVGAVLKVAFASSSSDESP